MEAFEINKAYTSIHKYVEADLECECERSSWIDPDNYYFNGIACSSQACLFWFSPCKPPTLESDMLSDHSTLDMLSSSHGLHSSDYGFKGFIYLFDSSFNSLWSLWIQIVLWI